MRTHIASFMSWKNEVLCRLIDLLPRYLPSNKFSIEELCRMEVSYQLGFLFMMVVENTQKYSYSQYRDLISSMEMCKSYTFVWRCSRIYNLHDHNLHLPSWKNAGRIQRHSCRDKNDIIKRSLGKWDMLSTLELVALSRDDRKRPEFLMLCQSDHGRRDSSWSRTSLV